MASLSKLLLVVGILGFVSGLGGFVKMHAWLRPDFVPPSPFLVVKDPQPRHLGFWLNLISLMLNSARPGCLFSVGLVILLSLPISSCNLSVISCLKNLSWIFLGLRVGIWSTAGGLDGWAWNEIKALPLPWFSGLAILLELV